MIASIAGLLAGFVLVLLLLGYLVLKTKLAVFIKLALIVIVTGFYWV